MQSEAIVVQANGGPEVLRLQRKELPAPGPGEVLLDQKAIGLNFIDVYMRTGLYPMPLPFTPGVEAAGTVEAIGPEVENVRVGDRVAYAATAPVGSYATKRLLPANLLVTLPDGIAFEQAAALMLKGCTAEYLVRRTFPVKAGDWVLLHAAAGGVGLLAGQWLKSIGAHVIGTVGSPEKADLAREHGCEHVILYRKENIAERVRRITGGRGVDVVYDSVGKDTFEASLDSLRPRGMLVSFGNASGPVPPFAPLLLSQKGSLFFTRAGFKDYYASAEDRAQGTQALFGMVLSGQIKVDVRQRFALAQAAEAHAALENRSTTGSSILVV